MGVFNFFFESQKGEWHGFTGARRRARYYKRAFVGSRYYTHLVCLFVCIFYCLVSDTGARLLISHVVGFSGVCICFALGDCIFNPYNGPPGVLNQRAMRKPVTRYSIMKYSEKDQHNITYITYMAAQLLPQVTLLETPVRGSLHLLKGHTAKKKKDERPCNDTKRR